MSTANEPAEMSRRQSETGPHPGSITPNNRSSGMAPSVQFDEQNLLASPSFHRERLPSTSARDPNSLPSSPHQSALDVLRSPYNGPLRMREGQRGSRNRHNSQTASMHSNGRLSRASEASASTNTLGGYGSVTGTGGKKRSRHVVTIPSWARDESPSPPHSPTTQSPSSRAAPRSVSDIESIAPTSHARGKGSEATVKPNDAAVVESTNTWPKPPTSPSVTSDSEEVGANTPDRWWTFTLPQKYRSKLHEHQLRMTFHHERMRTDAEQAAAAQSPKPTPKRTGSGDKPRKPKRKKTDDSGRSSDPNHSDYGSDDSSQDAGVRGRYMEGGLGGPAVDGAAAGLGASGLLNWRHGRKGASPTPQRNSSQSGGGTSTTRGGDEAEEQDHQKSSDRDLEKHGEMEYPTMSFKARLENPDVYTVHQPATPGWASPWKPEERGGGNSIEIGGFRFRANGTGYFPRTETKGSQNLTGWAKRRRHWFEAWNNFIIHNPFVPLLFRLINVAFTTATLAVAIKLFQLLHKEDATDSVGSSPIVAIIFAPLTLVHVGFQIWLEYFGRPIGLWTVTSKLFYTTIELIFICLWSAELALAFDNYFTSTLVCVAFGSPYIGTKQSPADRPMPLIDMSKKPYLCRLQGALIGLVFVSLLAYVIVLTVSLFRIFVRVTGGRR